MKNAIKQVDKNLEHMYTQYGTTCLITEVGKADHLLNLVHKRRVNKQRLVDSPIDAWDI